MQKNKLDTIKIGDQHWAMKNLNGDTFINGDPIPNIKTNKDWAKAYYDKKPAMCFYKNSKANGDKYGKLYNWYVVNDKRGIAAEGFHVPTKDEWFELLTFVEYEDKSASALKSRSGWKNYRNGKDVVGFCALPGSWRSCHKGKFGDINTSSRFTSLYPYGAHFWTTSKNGDHNAICFDIYHDSDVVEQNSIPFGVGLSIRCIKDS